MNTRTLPIFGLMLFFTACDSGTDSSPNGHANTTQLHPLITGVVPDTAYRGDLISIVGVRFTASTGLAGISIGGASALPVLWTDSLIITHIPELAAHGGVSVWIGSSVSKTFVLSLQTGSPPSSPTLSFISVDTASPGQTVRLGGRGFGQTQGNGEVLCSDVSAGISTWNDSTIQFVVPDRAGQASVIVKANGRSSNPLPLTIISATGPTITGLMPASGEPGQPIAIHGVNLGNAVGSVTFNGLAAPVTTWTDTQIAVTVPNNATSRPVVVHTSQGASNSLHFTLSAQNNPPTIASVTPASGAIGTTVIIGGGQFGSSPGTVPVNGVTSVIASWSPTSIATVVPAGASSGNVTVTVNNLTSNGIYFQVTTTGPVPTISDVRPNPADIGDRLRIHGTNFGPETPVVTISGVQGLLDEWRSDEIRVYVPVGAVTGPLVVTCGGRSSTPYQVTINGTIPGGLTVSNPSPSVIAGATTIVTISGGVTPYAIQTTPNPAVATAVLSGPTVTITGTGQGSTSLVVRDAATTPATVTISISVIPSGGWVSFSQHVQPIFNANCTSCHGGSGGLFLTPAQSYANLVNVQAREACTSEKRVLPGNASVSVLYKRLAGNTCGDRMPRGGNPLPAADIQKIADWINQGALNN